MSRKCEFCQKKPMSGNSITRRGLAKKTGGVGIKITSTTKRLFHPNLQTRRIKDEAGKIRKILVCAKCMKAGKVIFATR